MESNITMQMDIWKPLNGKSEFQNLPESGVAVPGSSIGRYGPGLYFHHTNNAIAARGANNRANIGNSSATE